MLFQIRDLPFAIKKLILWILLLIVGFCSFYFAMIMISLSNFVPLCMLAGFFDPPSVIESQLFKILVLIMIFEIPLLAVGVSYLVVRFCSSRLNRFLFSDIKRKRSDYTNM